MQRPSSVGAATRLVMGLAAALLALPGGAQPAIHVVEQDRVRLEVRPLTASTVEQAAGSFELEVDESGTSELELRVLWPDRDVPSRLTLRATLRVSAAGPIVRLESLLALADRSEVMRAKREITFSTETVTALFEVARIGERPLTLAITGELTRERTYSPMPSVGPPVSFQLDVEWVEGGRPVTLETNVLQTFVGQSVRYEFRLGEVGQAEAASVRLLPVRMLGDALRIEAEVNGTLPDPDGGLSMVSRREQWLSSSGTVSTLSLASGEPPTGFRFVVTPRF